MKYKNKLFFLLIVLGLFFAFSYGLGEQVIKKSTLGTVVNATEDQLVIRAYDLDSGEYIEKSYLINKNPTLKNIGSIKEIKSGDNVNIDYYVKDQKNIILSIFLEKLSEEEKMFQAPLTGSDKSDIIEEYTPEEMNLPEGNHKKGKQ